MISSQSGTVSLCSRNDVTVFASAMRLRCLQLSAAQRAANCLLLCRRRHPVNLPSEDNSNDRSYAWRLSDLCVPSIVACPAIESCGCSRSHTGLVRNDSLTILNPLCPLLPDHFVSILPSRTSVHRGIHKHG